MIPWHVVSGMHGTVMVMPRDGLKDAEGKALHYDKIFYIGEQDMYVPRDANGKFKSYESPGEAYTDTASSWLWSVRRASPVRWRLRRC
jgi:nitrite reductase (NO-forming)